MGPLVAIGRSLIPQLIVTPAHEPRERRRFTVAVTWRILAREWAVKRG